MAGRKRPAAGSAHGPAVRGAPMLPPDLRRALRRSPSAARLIAAEEQGDGDGELEDREMGGGLHRRPLSLHRSASCRGGAEMATESGHRGPPTGATMAELRKKGKEGYDEWAPLGRLVFYSGGEGWMERSLDLPPFD